MWFQVVRFRARTLLLHAVFRTQVLQFCVISGVAMQRMLSASPALGGFFSSWRAQYTSTSLLLWGQDPNYKSAGILVSSSGNLLALHLRKAETCPWRKSCALVQNQTFCELLLSARWCAPDYLLFKKLLFWTKTQDWTPSKLKVHYNFILLGISIYIFWESWKIKRYGGEPAQYCSLLVNVGRAAPPLKSSQNLLCAKSQIVGYFLQRIITPLFQQHKTFVTKWVADAKSISKIVSVCLRSAHLWLP